jgi:hypothetical protein
MRLNINFTHLFILAVLFISLGDRVLPQPMSTVSTQTRETIHQFLTGLFPKSQPENSHARTENAMTKLIEEIN